MKLTESYYPLFSRFMSYIIITKQYKFEPKCEPNNSKIKHGQNN